MFCIVLDSATQEPVIHRMGIAIKGKQGTGIGRLFGDGNQSYLWVHQIIRLPDHQAQSFHTLAIEDAASHPQTYLIGVTDTIEAGITTIAEQAVVVLLHGGCVVQADIILILVRDIKVLELGLQCLGIEMLTPVACAIEDQPTIDPYFR